MVTLYRSTPKIIGDVLKVINECGKHGINITQLLTKANLSYNKLCKLAKQLIEAGLIEERTIEGRSRYIITEKGKTYLDMYKQFEELSNSFGLKL